MNAEERVELARELLDGARRISAALCSLPDSVALGVVIGWLVTHDSHEYRSGSPAEPVELLHKIEDLCHEYMQAAMRHAASEKAARREVSES